MRRPGEGHRERPASVRVTPRRPTEYEKTKKFAGCHRVKNESVATFSAIPFLTGMLLRKTVEWATTPWFGRNAVSRRCRFSAGARSGCSSSPLNRPCVPPFSPITKLSTLRACRGWPRGKRIPGARNCSSSHTRRLACHRFVRLNIRVFRRGGTTGGAAGNFRRSRRRAERVVAPRTHRRARLPTPAGWRSGRAQMTSASHPSGYTTKASKRGKKDTARSAGTRGVNVYASGSGVSAPLTSRPSSANVSEVSVLHHLSADGIGDNTRRAVCILSEDRPQGR